MEILNMGTPELLFIAVFAFIIFGPTRAVEFIGQIGSAIASLKRNYNYLVNDINTEITNSINVETIQPDETITSDPNSDNKMD
ncbi:MAG: twin-arginine translocase TatA/TatE family subunit [Dehalococcoidia bacterium]